MIKKIIGGFVAPIIFTCCVAQEPKVQAETSTAPVVAEKKAVEVVQEVKVEITQELLDKGRRLYISNCISCHNKDPNIKGPIGPEMIDAPLEVMTSKIMTGKYPETLPEGFKPKRSTKLMRPIPKLKDDIASIFHWVQSVKKEKSN